VVYAGANRFTRVLDIKTATTTSTFGGAVKDTYTDLNDPAYWSRCIDELEKSARPSLDSGVVDAFVLETRELMVREKLAEAERAVWERSQVNVIDPVLGPGRCEDAAGDRLNLDGPVPPQSGRDRLSVT
jgi:hypothetical protein